ncbi:flagellar hook-basal body complex protein [Trichloromonas acetexigens]|jgi:flagellar hook protein FlgE|uniref:Flagellar hook protein FlgE n=1 Tax=Trichloromonas acetexigens TaxID=38815 RepID=A0A550JIN9_9BACT|nr:flagellar hook-basal body complex protein [Desulfuromonas acetexigens]TRO83082.1 flagellar hook-basal body complex protein [Desulfuromonas acetexigens]
MGILSSLYSGVSGLSTNGNALSVIGNNISNSNTIGFKSGRSVFSDLLSSSISASGGISQVGRGAGMSTVDNIFTQGTFENTAKNTDLAIEGEGFFIVRDPNTNTDSYTRAGAFRWDAEGYLVSPEGYRAIGYALNEAGNVSGDLTEIKVDTTTLSPPKATENVTFTTNLDAASQYPAPIIGKFVGVGRTLDTTAAGATDFSDPDGVLTINGMTLDIAGGGTYNQGSALEISTAIDSVAGINAEGIVIPGSINLSEVADKSSTGWTIPAGLTINGVSLAGAIPATVDRASYDVALVNHFNSLLNPVGVRASVDANTHSLTLTSMDGSNIQVINSADMSSSILSLNGALRKTVFSGLEIQAKGTDIGELTIDAGTNSTYGLVFNTGTSGRDAGFDITAPEATSNYANSVTIYDSLGNPHQTTVYFSKLNPATNPLQWEYNITVNAAELNLTPAQTGPYLISSGVLRFLDDGTLDPDFPSGLTTSPNDLAWNNNSDPTVQLNIDFNTTQWSNASVVISQDQDGFGTGTVAQLSLDNEGNILGNYSNGVPRSLYRISLAKFSNAAGLTKTGNNMYQTSGTSGSPIVGTVGSGIGQIFTNSLEQSNVDLAAEFVSMITTQRGFQANSKIITTTDEMLNELINLKR